MPLGADEDLDVDLAELRLGQSLTALSGSVLLPQTATMKPVQPRKTPKSSRKSKQGMKDVSVVPANSLTRTLIQRSRHSSDSS
ncbi:hypothetical protein C8J57DRAFT_1270683 [Mycena rebaudengoi]|nr:hypothetical protein C8J57DRAFT_1270683 [Mycena rebaudengoi]